MKMIFKTLGNGKCKLMRIEEYTGEEIITIPDYSEEGDIVVAIERSVLRSCKFNTIILPVGYSFETYSALDFDSSTIKNILAADNSSTLCSFEGILYTKDGSKLLVCPRGKAGSITIPSGTTIIGDNAFNDCNHVKSVLIPNSVSKIGHHAFAHCLDISEVFLPEGLESIEDATFYCCFNLTEVKLPDSLKVIGEYAFCCTKKISQLIFPNQLERIGAHAFDDCIGLEKVGLPVKLHDIEHSLFQGCKKLRTITLPECLQSIGEFAFEGTAINTITIPENVSKISSCAFRNCNKLECIVIPQNVSSIEFACFEDCTALKAVSLPEQLQRIGDRAFSGCTVLTDITLPKHLKCIEDGAFFGCCSLKKLVMYPELEQIGENVFANCFVLELETNLSEEDDEYWDYYGEAYEYVREYVPQNSVILACPVCGQIHSEELSLCGEGYFSGAETVAYGKDIVEWNEDCAPIYEGIETEVTVYAPFYCHIGNSFSVVYGQKVVKAKLKSILAVNKSSAKVMIEVTAVKKMLDFVKTLSSFQISALRNKSYDRSDYPGGDWHNPQWHDSLEDDWVTLSNTYGGGDINYSIYIYTDEFGVDHLIRSDYDDFDSYYSFFGDKVLGLHEEVEL